VFCPSSASFSSAAELYAMLSLGLLCIPLVFLTAQDWVGRGFSRGTGATRFSCRLIVPHYSRGGAEFTLDSKHSTALLLLVILPHSSQTVQLASVRDGALHFFLRLNCNQNHNIKYTNSNQ
jgi:hypothetical protein